MIIALISVILGIFKAIPPEHFDGWTNAMLIELLLDIPALLFALYYINRAKKRAEGKLPTNNHENYCEICVHNDRNVLPPPVCYYCDGANRFESRFEAETNPYVKNSLRWNVWEAEHKDER